MNELVNTNEVSTYESSIDLTELVPQLKAVEDQVSIFGGILEPKPIDQCGLIIEEAKRKKIKVSPFDYLLLVDESDRKYLARAPEDLYKRGAIPASNPVAKLDIIDLQIGSMFPEVNLGETSIIKRERLDDQVDEIAITEKARLLRQEDVQQRLGQFIYLNVLHETYPGHEESIRQHGIFSRGEAILAPLDRSCLGDSFLVQKEGTAFLYRVPISNISIMPMAKGRRDGLSLSHYIVNNLIPESVSASYPYPTELGFSGESTRFRGEHRGHDIGGGYHLPAAYLAGSWDISKEGKYVPHSFTQSEHRSPGEPKHFLLFSKKGQLFDILGVDDIPGNRKVSKGLGHVWALDSNSQLVYRYFYNPKIAKFDTSLGFNDFLESEDSRRK